MTPNHKLVFTIRQVIHDQNITDDEIMRSWKAVKISMEQKRKRSELSVYEDEYSILSKGENENEDNFSSYTATIPQKYRLYFEQIAVVDRLTVTQAFTGFTRITRNEANIVAIIAMICKTITMMFIHAFVSILHKLPKLPFFN